MSYYSPQAGDYKTYGYAGDPGFLSSLWRGVKKIAGPIIGGLIGGPVGAVLGGAIGGAKPAPAPMQFPMVPTAGRGGFPIVGQVTMPGGASISGGVMVPGRGPLPPFAPGGVGQAGRGGAMMPSGYHYAKDGSGRLVRNRRMNVANPRALRRSMRRVQGFEKLARRTITFTRRVKMKKRKTS
jgi:hypothetical protein